MKNSKGTFSPQNQKDNVYIRKKQYLIAVSALKENYSSATIGNRVSAAFEVVYPSMQEPSSCKEIYVEAENKLYGVFLYLFQGEVTYGRFRKSFF